MSAWTTKTAIRLVAPRAEHYVVITFFPIENDRSNVHVVPPVVKRRDPAVSPGNGSKVLVYLKHPNARLVKISGRMDGTIPHLWL